MQDRNEYHMHASYTRQHYLKANEQKKPAIPLWLALLVIVACIGLAGGIAR